MVAIQEIRAQLTDIKRFGPGLVGVFVGGTSGIGETTAREFARYGLAPRLYLVGRNAEQAAAIKTECAEINPESQVHFIQSDVALLQNVDKVCKEISNKEDKVNLLFLSAGILTMKGRDETPEGLDKKVSLHYYSRLRFIQNFLPQLTTAASATGTTSPLSRVVAVLAGGLEGALDTADLSLKNTYSLRNAANHATSMTTLSFHTLAAANPNVTFIHSAPGGVVTNLFRGLGPVAKFAFEKSTFMWSWLAVPIKDSGERHLWASTVDEYGKGGAVIVGSDSAKKENNAVVVKMREDGTEKAVWEHTTEIFDKIEKEGKY